MDFTYGHSMYPHFMLDPSFVNLNHGSFGCLPRAVYEDNLKLTEEVESNPDLFVRTKLAARTKDVRRRLEKILNVEEDECVIVPNVNHGIALILRSIPWEQGDVLVYTSTAFSQIKRNATLQFRGSNVPSPDHSEFPLTFPESRMSILSRFRYHLRLVKQGQKGGSRVVALFDTIVSTPAIAMPWKDMVAICREEGVLSVIDAAHSLGQELNINLGEAQPDFWVANCSKWLFAKRGSAVLYVPKRWVDMLFTRLFPGIDMPCRNQHLVPYSIPAAIMGPGKGIMSDFATEFAKDRLEALDFRAAIGGEEKIVQYSHELSINGGIKMAEILDTEVMPADASSDTKICMVNVRLPFSTPVKPSFDVFTAFDHKLFEEQKAYATIFYHNSDWWARVSAQVYNEISDFERLGAILLVICKEIEQEFGHA
ncbi:hypothetical protein V5O48_007873 [Marasmius crinis-equi]|uniref:Aminotransferase class V domain-containing protein n=1 Tax=Marasmius crinis-equi TaxID=585013 RepID=A0ABR3FG72_9AGAR